MPRQSSLSDTSPCPCGSGTTYINCCSPYISGSQAAPTPEALMRSRYSAHVVLAIDYLMASWAPESRSRVDREAVASWAAGADWQGLTVLRSSADGDQGSVEFVARYIDEHGTPQAHHERSRFRREQGQWLFIDGTTPKPPGRNDPCLCGSGRKYKRCCA